MLIKAEWLGCDDGVVRPVVFAQVFGSGALPCAERFLVDSGADRTVLSASLLAKLSLAVSPPSEESCLVGVGGGTAYALVSTTLGFARDGGGFARVRGEFAAFTNVAATDFSVLGRDVLNHFDVILSRPRNEAILLAPNHRYHVTPAD
jgi:hypothetical protein